MQSSSKTPAILGVLLVIIAIFYYFYADSNAPVSPDSSLTLTASAGSGADGGAVGSEVLALLAEIRGLNIDTTFFQTPVYQSLTDFSVTIPPEPVGKDNPFIPLAGSAPVTAPSSATGR